MALDPVDVSPTLRQGLDPRLAAVRGAPRGDEAALRKAGEAFEAVLMQRVVEAMRATVPRSDGGPRVTGGQIYDHLIEQALAEHLSAAGGLGVAELFASGRGVRRPAGPGMSAALAAYGQAPAGVGSEASPLADRLPPQDDAWLDRPDAAERLLESLIGKNPEKSEPVR